MNYEQKYKEALERAKDCCVNKKFSELEDTAQQLCEYVFPELRESEDEKIRKWIINEIKVKHHNLDEDNVDFVDKAIAWLEKQGEQMPVEQDTEIHDLWVYIREWNDKFGRLPKDEDELAACIDYVMKRQKPADKIEPKFKVGDWVVYNNANVYQVKKIDYTNIIPRYELENFDGDKLSIPFTPDYNLRNWTVQDANDGDVLVVNNKVFIYAHRKQLYSIAVAHCFVDSAGGFYFDGEFGYMENGNLISLATKEQRDTLFAKMKEAGYEWDAEKKELNKIEKQDEKKPWSEEDELAIERLVDTIEIARSFKYGKPKAVYTDEILDSLINWLKSLTPNHWKPSEEQMEALWNVIPRAVNSEEDVDTITELSALYEELKNL